MRRIVAGLFLFLTLGCGAKSNPTVFVPPPPLPLSISIYPQLVRVYSDFRFKCLLPEDADGTAIFGIEGIFHTAHTPLDKRMYERLVTAPCHELLAYCGYKPQGKPDIHMVRQTIEPVGECR